MSEIRPIDATELLSRAEVAPMYAVDAMVCYDLIKSAPTLDAVAVVRCKDCKFLGKTMLLGKSELYCKNLRAFVKESDFCSRAERKENRP